MRSCLGAELGFLGGLSPTARAEVVPGQPRGPHCCPLQIKGLCVFYLNTSYRCTDLALSVCVCVYVREANPRPGDRTACHLGTSAFRVDEGPWACGCGHRMCVEGSSGGGGHADSGIEGWAAAAPSSFSPEPITSSLQDTH